ncbi:hypothetical protein WJX81_002729 [Elliptochloris bilobata]|uniref:Uncharacterized protein n=1 Tax=Elliptochloris bilobata TaxID=381761 RepID=A0AAW1S950_9CHLO
MDVVCPYNESLRQALSRLRGGQWVQEQRAWRFPLAQRQAVTAALYAAPGVQVTLEDLPPVACSILEAAEELPDESARYESLPPRLEARLMGFQRTGVRFALQRGGRALIGDEMGLGKTVQAIALMAAFHEEWPCLLVVPSSLREVWADALVEWLGATERDMLIVNAARDLEGLRGRLPGLGSASAILSPSGPGLGLGPGSQLGFVIVSYALVGKLAAVLAGDAADSGSGSGSGGGRRGGGGGRGGGRSGGRGRRGGRGCAPLAQSPFGLVVCDESHYLKDFKAQRTKDTLPLLQAARRALLLTGTPALSRPRELLTQVQALLPGAALTMRAFGDRYCIGFCRFGQYQGASNLDELYSVLTASVMVRRRKADVLTELPPKRRQQVHLALPREDQAALARAAKEMDVKRLALEADGPMTAEQRQLVTEFYMRCAELKVKAVQEYVRELLDQEQKFLIFAHHRVLLDGIQEVLNKARVRNIRIDGKVPPTQRQGLVDTFQGDPGVIAAVLSITAAGTGLTLTAASLVVFAEYSWTPGELVQAEDRVHRIGQAQSVNIYYLHVRGSVDDIMWSALQTKLENVGQALDGREDSLHVTAAAPRAPPGQATLSGFLLPAVEGVIF